MNAGFAERWSIHAGWLIGAVVLVAISGLCFLFLGSDLLPEMDEGGFIVDYLTPAGNFTAGN